MHFACSEIRVIGIFEADAHPRRRVDAHRNARKYKGLILRERTREDLARAGGRRVLRRQHDDHILFRLRYRFADERGLHCLHEADLPVLRVLRCRGERGSGADEELRHLKGGGLLPRNQPLPAELCADNPHLLSHICHVAFPLPVSFSLAVLNL